MLCINVFLIITVLITLHVVYPNVAMHPGIESILSTKSRYRHRVCVPAEICARPWTSSILHQRRCLLSPSEYHECNIECNHLNLSVALYPINLHDLGKNGEILSEIFDSECFDAALSAIFRKNEIVFRKKRNNYFEKTKNKKTKYMKLFRFNEIK